MESEIPVSENSDDSKENTTQVIYITEKTYKRFNGNESKGP